MQGKVSELQGDLATTQSKATGSVDAVSNEIKVLEEVHCILDSLTNCIHGILSPNIERCMDCISQVMNNLICFYNFDVFL